ncbi:hypothetical protein [Paenibacillus sp. MMS18-CY102]|uniref:hypothetical protein n=1 Tax=Paenibacillus sp. MMS18-CY102 TaxID=2682849 RepID=UPI001923D419|nr:hypothetical protein [Paenibacillus sp. MMS18-CY102]
MIRSFDEQGITYAKAERADLPHILKLQYEAYQSEAEIYQVMIPPLKQSLSELEQEFDAQSASLS